MNNFRTIIAAALSLLATAATATDRFYIESVTFEPGETKTVALCLENSHNFCGFQTDITLTGDLEFATTDSKAYCRLSGRTNADYIMVSNMISRKSLRVGAFSANHTPISGNTGALLLVDIHAGDKFDGGTIELSNVIFANSDDHSVILGGSNINVSLTANNLYIPDFDIYIGETKEICLILDNNVTFAAFQADITLPEWLEFVDNSATLTSRAVNHMISVKKHENGTFRLIAMSLENKPFSADNGSLITFQVKAIADAATSGIISLRNLRFSTPEAYEYTLENSDATVTTHYATAEDITLSQTTTSLIIGSSVQLRANIKPDFAYSKEVTWSCSDANVATVSESGLVTAVSVGTATITARCGDVSATCEVTVLPIVGESITLSETRVSLVEGASRQLTATVLPDNTTDKTVTWATSDASVATVSESGLVTAISVGTATVTARCGEVEATCEVTVLRVDAESITLSDTQVSLIEGANYQLTATILPENTTNKTVIWHSLNNNIAKVSKGLVTAVAVGKTTLTARCGEVTATCEVTVEAEEDGIDNINFDGTTRYDVYSLDGVLVRKRCTGEELRKLQNGIYIVKSPKATFKIFI